MSSICPWIKCNFCASTISCKTLNRHSRRSNILWFYSTNNLSGEHLEYDSRKHFSFVDKLKLKWFGVCRSGINPSDLYSIYEYLANTLFPRSTEDDLRGGSLTRSQRSSYANCLDSHYGAYLTGPEHFSDNCKPAPLVYIYNADRCQLYRMIVYSALSAAMCLFVEGKDFFIIDLTASNKLESFRRYIADWRVLRWIAYLHRSTIDQHCIGYWRTIHKRQSK